ncbi:hypothetical protein DFJ58DRAFT_659238 [Suillus subalutaceus]|uniref:uncharacterized protein n=1 Tax=Suillus subalutaceus TaxID=48586 RepID=UPI001B869AFC|nr:uncharacterized protein DFJ58DRAFT_659238 [Suillus subalutaceus]KAG1857010.1 hypothetical protein DFJ58DRAFT_659238 [Suillus subalutaceus]
MTLSVSIILAAGWHQKYVHAFNDFKCHPTPLTSSTPPDKHPWAPFRLWLEFDIAELALEACLNNGQTDRLIKFCNQCTSRQEKFMFQNHKDIHNRWDAVFHRVTGFTQDIISVPYNDSIRQFNLYYWDLWEWVADLLHNPQLFPHMVFNAQQFSKFDGKTFIHFVDKPFTADTFWNVQVCINIICGDFDCLHFAS